MREVQIQGKDNEVRSYNNGYRPLDYLTNYTSLLTTVSDKVQTKKIKRENENQLRKYYESKRTISFSTHRHSSIVSGSENSITPTERSKVELFVDQFLSCAVNEIDPYQLSEDASIHSSKLNNPSFENMVEDSMFGNRKYSESRLYGPFDENENNDPLEGSWCDKNETRRAVKEAFSSSYYKYYKKLLTVDLKDFNILKRHNLWIPSMRNNCKDLLVGNYQPKDNIFKDKSCPLFVKGIDYIPPIYDSFTGSSVMRSIFSEFKLPSLTYQCSIEFNNHIFMLGGLMGCHRYDEEGPNLDEYYVDGIKNLPPPLLPSVINNPSMIDNPHLYVLSIESSRLSRPEMTGQIPPPMCCMTASKLTERHIFFYGGFEIKTETLCDDNGNYYIKKRAFLNNTGYILDTVAFKFTKVEINAQSYQFVKYPTFAPRFGHMQLSVTDVEGQVETSRENSDITIDSNITYRANGNPQRSHSQKSECSSNRNNNSLRHHSYSNNFMGTAIVEAKADSSSTTGKTEDNDLPQPSRIMSPTNSVKMNNGNHNSNIYTILIFGGYRQTCDDKYEAMNDMWRLDIKITSRGKRSYLEFADTVIASKIPIDTDVESGPPARAFFAYSLPYVCLLCSSSLETKLLKRLNENFKVELGQSKPCQNKSSTPIFPNIPHSKTHNPAIRSNSESESETESKISINSGFRKADLKLQDHSTHYLQKSSSRGRTIVIQGGSNNLNVFGDMWWFDLDSLKWTPIQTYAKSTKDCGGLVPINMKQVGHVMTNVGYMAVCLGGLTQEEIFKIYKEENSKPRSFNDNIGNDMLNIFDLSTQVLQGREVQENLDSYDDSVVVSKGSNFKSSQVTCVAGSVVESDGTVFLVGGLGARRSGEGSTFYLRGTILEFILPSMSLAS